MAGEVFNLAILLTAKDAASGTLDRFAANSHRATENIKKDLASLDKTTKAQIDAITKNIGKKTAEVGKLGNQFSKIDTLNAKGLASAEKRSTSILTNLQNEAKGLDALSQKLRADGKEDAAKAAEKLSRSLKDEVKQMESVGSKIKQIQKLRAEGTDEAKRQAAALAAEIKNEVRSLDQLKSKWEEVKDLQSDTLDTKFKSDGLRQQISQIDDLENHYEKLRENLNRDLAVGSIGLAGLYGLKKGVDEAGNYEEAMLDLRQAYQENARFSNFSNVQQESQIKRIGALATDLGNKYQGSTADYVNMFTAMNKAGIDAETTLNGAGKAAAYLANLTGAIRLGQAPQLAEDLGSYGKMFDLQGDEYLRAVETFSAIKDRFNLDSGNLIESSKYFFSTAKGTMNLRGAEGATETAKLFAFAKRFAGREGSEAGTSLDALITQFISHSDPRKSLEKEKGIKLEFFNEKGEFGGVENMFRQLEKMRTLNPEERAERLNGIFGEQGSRIANAMVEQGVQGWQNITAEMNKAVSVQTLIEQKMNTYNAKTEALSGSWQNLKATAFTPMLDDAKKFLDYGNQLVGTIQKFSAENPGLTKGATTLAFYGSTAMIVYSAFKTLTTGVRMFRIASAFSRGDNLATYLNSTASAANAASTSMATATTKTTGLRGAINNLRNSQTVKIGVQIGAIMGIEYLLGIIQSEIQKAVDAGDARKNAAKSAQNNYQAFQQTQQDGVQFSKQDFENQANTTWFSVKKSGLDDTLPSQISKKSLGMQFSSTMTQTYLYPLTKLAGATNPFIGGFGYGHQADKKSLAQGFKQTAPELADSRVMSAFLRQLETRIPDQKEQQRVKEGLQTAFPESFSVAMKEIAGLSFAPLTESVTNLSTQMNAQALNYETQNQSLTTFNQNLTNLQQPFEQTQTNVANLGSSAQNVPPTLNRISSSANSASSALDSLSAKVSNWQMPTPQIQTYQLGVPSGTPGQPTLLPAHAVGGIVERDGLAMLHAGNVITPAKTTKGLRGFNSLMSLAEDNQSSRSPRIADVQNFSRGESNITIHAPFTMTVNGDDKNAVQKLEKKIIDFQKNLDRTIGRMMENGRLRS